MTLPSAPARRYLAQEAGLLVALPYLLFVAATSNGIVNYELTRVSLGALTAAVIAGSGVTVWRRRARGQNSLAITAGRAGWAGLPLGRSLALFLSVYFLAALNSIDPRRSLGEAWLTGAYALSFLFTVELVNRRWPRELFVKALLVTSTVLIGLSVYTALHWYGRWLVANPRMWLPAVPYRLPAPNTLAIFLNLMLTVAVARLWVARAPASRFFLGLWILLALGLIFLTSSRSGWLGAAAGVSAAVGLSLRGPGQGVSLLRLWEAIRRRRVLLIVGLLAGAVGLGLVGWLAYRQAAHPTHASSFLVARGNFWTAAWQAFVRSPWTGQGPFTFGSAFLHVSSVPPDLLYIHAHSLFFNLLAETGLLGVVASGLLGAATLHALWRQLRTLRGEDRAVAVGACAAAVAYGVHGIFETVSAEPSNAFVISILLGAAVAPGPALAAPGAGHVRRWPIMGLALVLIVTGWYGVWLSTPLHRGVLAANKAEWKLAATYFAEAVRRDPGSAVAHQQLALAKSVLASSGDADALADAVAEFEETMRLDPDWASNHANLGALYAAHGDTAPALRELRVATAQAYGAPLYHLNLGVIAERTGESDEARRAYLEALRLRPHWAEAYFWRATPFRSAVAAEWREQNPSALPTLAGLERIVAAGSPYARDYARLAVARLQAGQIGEAARLAAQANLAYLQTGEDRLEVLWASAELAAAQGDRQTAVKLGEQVLTGFRDQSVFGPGAFGDPSYGPFLFRRETMALDLVPQLTLIHLTDLWAARMVSLGDWNTALGDVARAEAIYRIVLTFVPDNVEAQARLR